jgi:hypothetical protein
MIRFALLGLLLASIGIGAPIAVHNTGVNNADVVQSIGSPTSFWTLVSQPAGAGYAVGSTPFRYFNGAYYPDNSLSGWVSPNVTGNAGAGGNYTFQLAFDLTGLDPASAVITGLFGTDNDGSIALNGGAPAATTGFGAFGGPTAFTFNSGFIAGINHIAVTFNNGGDPTAFRVQFSGATANPITGAVPEPASVALIAVGFGALYLSRRRLSCR